MTTQTPLVRSQQRVQSARRTCLAIAWCFAAFATTATAANRPPVASWAQNAPEWNTRLGVSLMRQGCSLTPAACIERIRQASGPQRVSRWSIAMVGTSTQAYESARAYGQLSRKEPLLVEVGIDDLAATLRTWRKETPRGPRRSLGDVIEAAKAGNPKLQFVVTLYEDELEARVIEELSVATRRSIDRVALYLHYREHAARYPEYVTRVRALFPAAQVWGGVYAYDRRAYVPCGGRVGVPCSESNESTLFQQALNQQLQLWRAGRLAGLEFYPGNFGLEADWPGWKNDRLCRPNERETCVGLTRRMRESLSTTLQQGPAQR